MTGIILLFGFFQCFACWLVGWLVGRLVGWLGWLVFAPPGWLVEVCANVCLCFNL